eukprot:15352012-Ditylum_brightwellii.AAC.1
MTAKHISTTEFPKLNYVIMYLKVTTLADVTTSDGKSIIKRQTNSTTAKLINTKNQWLHQEKPGEESWNQWRKVLAFICKGD